MGAEPITTEEVLAENHAQSNEHGVGGTNKSIAFETVATEDETADDGLEQVVGKTHTTEYTQVVQHAAHTLEGIPCRDNARNYHQQDEKAIYRFEPHLKCTKVNKAQGNDKRC